MNIDEDDFSDEYDFMDDDDEEGQNARRQTRAQDKTPKLKYMDLLQKIADRYEDEITIDLDDLATVWETSAGQEPMSNALASMTSYWRQMAPR